VPTKLLLSTVLFVEALVIYFAVAKQSPMSGDDYSYLYQARLFAAGKLYAQDQLYDSASALHDCVETNCLNDFHGRRFSQYPPGWPAILAIGAALGVPWAIDPFLGALLVFLMLWYVERKMGNRWAVVTWLLITLCFFFAYYAASTRAHISTALFVFAAFLSYEAAEQRASRAPIFLFVAGAFLGYSSMIRYIDWVPLGLWIGFSLLRRKNLIGLALFMVGFTLLASGNLLYDASIFGNPFQLPTTVNNSPSGTANRLMVSWTGLKVTGVRLIGVAWSFPPVILLGLFYRRYRPSPKVRMYVALFLMNVGVYYFYPASSGGPGPRYLLAYFPFLVLAVVDLCRWIEEEGNPNARFLWWIGIVCLLVGNLVFATVEGYRIYSRCDLVRTLQQTGPGEKIVLLKTGAYQTKASDLTRNPPDLATAPILYFSWCTQNQRDVLLKRFPGRKIFVYEYPSHLHPYLPLND